MTHTSAISMWISIDAWFDWIFSFPGSIDFQLRSLLWIKSPNSDLTPAWELVVIILMFHFCGHFKSTPLRRLFIIIYYYEVHARSRVRIASICPHWFQLMFCNNHGFNLTSLNAIYRQTISLPNIEHTIKMKLHTVALSTWLTLRPNIARSL